MTNQSDSRKREHGVIESHSVRTVGMDPVLACQVIREEEDQRYPLLASSLEPPVCDVTVASDAHACLVNGLGANWSPPGQGEEAFPAEDDEAGWRRLFAAMDATGIRWVRYWLQPGFLFTDGHPDSAHRFFTRLDRLQHWAARRGATIMLELSHVPENFQGGGVYDAPADNQNYVDNYIVPVMRHILDDRRCDRIRQLCLFNEPFNADVKPYIFFPPSGQNPLEYYLDLHERLRTALDQAGYSDIGLIGPDTANLFQRHIEMFEDKGLSSRVAHTFSELDCHLWRMRFDYYPPSKRWPGYPISEGISRYLEPTIAAAKRMGKTLSLTETGAMYFNEDPRTDRVTQHDAFLTMAEATVRSVNAGVAGVMFWAFTNSGRIDGQWGWIGTRETDFMPVPNLHNGFAVLLRHHRPGAEIRRCTVRHTDFSSFISAGALWMPGQGETIWLVNDHPVENIKVQITLPADRSHRNWQVIRKGFAPEIQTLESITDTSQISIVLPGMTLTTLTTLDLSENKY